MSLVHEQSIFLLHVAELIRKSSELGFQASGGELYRTSEQQALHVKNGRSTTMNSQHLKRLAVDLNFFKATPDGELKLTYDVEELRVLGQFWEGLDAANRWGGNWTSFKDAPHFERRETATAAPAVAAQPVQSAAVVPAATKRGAGLTQAAVGARCPNGRDDVETVQRLLNLSAGKGLFACEEVPLKMDGAFGGKTLNAIFAYQRTVNGEQAPDGRIDPVSPAMSSLCAALPDVIEPTLLGLAYLRAADKDVEELAAGIAKTMANRNIDTPLRRAHFLAQIGHESGELRFRAEIASGEAYEGRIDLGNAMPGDGRRFKGRGLIQLTGRANYAEYGRALGREAELLQTPELVETDPELCVDVAGWFWARRNLNALADADDLTSITKRINGGLNGLEDRRRLLKRTRSLFGV
jgi:predicted chitinase